MRIETKYGIHDKVWKINQAMPKAWVSCMFCGGRAQEASALAPDTEITGADGSKRRCPECQGHGGHYEHLKLAWQVTDELTIGQLEYRLSSKETKESYMCSETGVGGGTIYYVDTLYPTRKEAQAECDRRNKENEDAH